MGVRDNNPTFKYINVTDLVITHDDTRYPINNIYTNKKYLIWDKSIPYELKSSDIRPVESLTKFLVIINDNGVHTVVPSETVKLTFDGLTNGTSSSNMQYESLKEQVDANTNKYNLLVKDVNGVTEIIGSTEEFDDTIINAINTIKKTNSQFSVDISEIKTSISDEFKENRVIIVGNLVSYLEALSNYKLSITSCNLDVELTTDEIANISKCKDELILKCNQLVSSLQDLSDLLLEKNDERSKILTDAITKLNENQLALINYVNSALSNKKIDSNETTYIITQVSEIAKHITHIQATVDEIVTLGYGDVILKQTNSFQVLKDKTSSELTKLETDNGVIKNKYSKLEQTVDGLTTKVGEIESSDRVKSIKQMYYLSTSPNQTIGGSWLDKLPSASEQEGKFLFFKTITYYYGDKPPVETEPICITGKDGENGADGVDGKDGVSLIYKGEFTSHPSNPQNGWYYRNTIEKKTFVYQGGAWYQMTVDGQDGLDGNDGKDGLSIEHKGTMVNPPSNPKKNWTYKDSDNGIVYIYTGVAWEVLTYDGSDGIDGADGTNGLSVFITYHDSLTQPYAPTGNGTTGGWHTNCTSSSVWISQKVSSDVNVGTWGTPIKIKGQDGTTYYTWIMYADDQYGNGISNDPTGKEYIGFAYNKTTPTESTNKNEYTWSLIKGTDGVPGRPGQDGITYYTWIKYSDYSNGNPCYDTPNNNTKYIGIATNKTTQYESSDYTQYKWSLFKGADGVPGQDGVSVEEVVIEYAKNQSTTSSPTSGWSTSMPSYQKGYYLWYRTRIKYSNSNYYVYSTPVCDQSWKASQEVYTQYEQLKDKFTWVVKGGTSSSNMVLSDDFYSVVSKNIRLSAKNITMEGLVTANNNFKILADGSMEAINGKFKGDMTGGSINIADKFKVDKYGRGTFEEQVFCQNLYASYLRCYDGLQIQTPNDTWSTIVRYDDTAGRIRFGFGAYDAGRNVWYDGGDYVNVRAKERLKLTCKSWDAESETKYSAQLQYYYGNDGSTVITFRPAMNNNMLLGSSSNRWKCIYSNEALSVASDRNAKENIEYINPLYQKATTSDITLDDLYSFVKNELYIAKYNYKNSSKDTIGFIAQDLLEVDVNNSKAYDIANIVVNVDEEKNLSYDTGAYMNVLAGALKKAISKIEEQDKRIKLLEGK